MLRYLVMHGVDESRIWKEEASTSTRENLLFSKTIMMEKGLDIKETKVAIISNEFHLFRAGIVAKRIGLNATGIKVKTPGVLRYILYCIREVAAIIQELVLY